MGKKPSEMVVEKGFDKIQQNTADKAAKNNTQQGVDNFIRCNDKTSNFGKPTSGFTEEQFSNEYIQEMKTLLRTHNHIDTWSCKHPNKRPFTRNNSSKNNIAD